MSATTILLYGRSHAGKTTQIGVLAEHVKKTTGKNTRLYTADKGGLDAILPYVDVGVIEVFEIGEMNPWIFLNRAVRGYTPNAAGKWALDKEKNAGIGLFAFESMRGIAELVLQDMATRGGDGQNIGGGPGIQFTVQADGETLKIAGTNMAMFGVAQAKVSEQVWLSQQLPGQYVLWTTSMSKDDDFTSGGKVLGPDVIGKALTAEVPRWFNYTFRLDAIPSKAGSGEKHVLYLGMHTDVNSGNATAMGNTRRPLDAPELKTLTIEPANIVTALDMLAGDNARKVAADKIRARLAAK